MKEVTAMFFEFGESFVSILANDLYDYVYTPMAWIMLAIALISTLAYYVFFDRPRFHRWWHWLIVMGVTVGVVLITGIIYTTSAFNSQGIVDYGISDFIEFLIALVLYTALVFFLFSLFLKRFSTNRTKTPF